jgi:ribosomal protein S18 acetylase RimI-like enzyme
MAASQRDEIKRLTHFRHLPEMRPELMDFQQQERNDSMNIIRPATSDDAPAIAHVQIETWRSAYRDLIASEFLDAISEDHRTEGWSEILERPEQATFVAEAEDRGIVGFANGGPERDGREDFRAELYAIYILPDCHGQGIGKRLVSTFAQWLLDSGFRTMMVWVLTDNPSRHFYDRLGGRLVEHRDIAIGEQKRLSEVAYGWGDVRGLIVDNVPP